MRAVVLKTLLVSLLLLAASGDLRAQDTPDPNPTGTGQGPAGPGATGPGAAAGSREAMWPAPTAEDWAKPCLVTWQRTWEDALAVSEETDRPILVCVNMDGEIASEHYAGIRYRQPEITKLYEPYVSVIASVYRHTPRDHDEEGRRIPCPRFGTVTCGEHIRIEPILYEQYFDTRRIAPRHVMIELDGAETYDVFYAFDTQSVFQRIEQGIVDRGGVPDIERGDRGLEELVGSRDVVDRIAVERRYRQADRTTRVRILEAAMALGADTPVDVLRLAIFGLDLDLARRARAALAQSTSTEAIDLITEALRVPMEGDERLALVAALERLGAGSARAQTLAVVHRGLAAERSGSVDLVGWSSALDEAAPGGDTYAEQAAAVEGRRHTALARLDEQDTVLRSEDALAHLDLAESFLEYAYDNFEREPDFARYLFMDAREAARKAESLGETGWRTDAALSIAAYYLGDFEQAHARAEAAMAGGETEAAPGWNAMAVVAIFVQSRQEAIQRAVGAKTEWPPEWLADVRAAYAVLARHPHGTDLHFAAHYDFMNWLGAVGRSRRVLFEGLERFPGSWELHDRLRRHVLWERGPEHLEQVYAGLLAGEAPAPDMHWFAGHAAVSVAEALRQSGRDRDAAEAYGRAIAHFEADIVANPEARAEADHHIALSHAGRARLMFGRGQIEAALDAMLLCFARAPGAASARDGLNLSPVDTAKMLLANLVESDRADLVIRLETALGDLDPRHLALPAFERETPIDTAPPDARAGRALPRRRAGAGR